MKSLLSRPSQSSVAVILCAIAFLTGSVSDSRAADARIGIYRDALGYSCSFNQEPGLVTAYVVVTPGTGGTRGVRFAAPIPSCFDATFIAETIPDLVAGVGSSQTGISLSPRDCQTSPFHVLEITYMDNGGTTPCCEFPIVADPFVGQIEAVDCLFAAAPVTGEVAYFNADASCACGPGAPLPDPPFNPLPADGSTAQSIGPVLFWSCSDPNSFGMTCDLYFGTDPDPPLLVANLPAGPFNSYATGFLTFGATYYWKVVIRNSVLGEATGPVWSFTVTNVNDPPSVPSNPVPPNGTSDVLLNVILRWQATDPEGQALMYDVYFGTEASPPLVASNVVGALYDPPGELQLLTTYRWRIVARDPGGAETEGPLWLLTTKASNLPPTVPSSPSPANNAVSQSPDVNLSWQSTDPEGETPLEFDVYFGTSATPPLVASNVAVKNYDPGTLALSTNYRWRIVARDAMGLETSGPTWQFTTANAFSLTPSNPSPPDNGVTSQSPMLSWSSLGTQFTVFLGTSSFPFNPVGTTSVPQFSPGFLQPGMRYYWWVFASNGNQSAAGPVWSFVVDSSLPVAFSRFDAKSSGSAVDIRWELSSDEPMTGFTLYRRDGRSSLAHAIAEGAVTGVTGSYLDTSVDAGKTYRYELLIRTADGDEFRSQEAKVTLPALALALHQNQPNPFNPQTSIRYDIPAGGATRVRLLILDISGRVVRTLVDENQGAGTHEVRWVGRNDRDEAVASGVYFYVLDVDGQRLTRKLVLLK